MEPKQQDFDILLKDKPKWFGLNDHVKIEEEMHEAKKRHQEMEKDSHYYQETVGCHNDMEKEDLLE